LGLVSKQAYSNTINIIIGFIAGAINTIIVLPRAFDGSLDDWGLLKLILSFSMILAPVFGIGVNNIVIREYTGNRDERYRKSILGFALLMGIVGALLSIAFVYFGGLSIFINNRDSEIIAKDIISLLVLAVSLILSQVFSGFIVANHNTPVISFVNDFFLKVTYLILSLYYLFNPFDFSLFLKLYVATYVIALIIYIAYSVFLGFKVMFWFKNLNIKELLTYGFYTVLDKGAAIIVANLDIIMIAYLLKLSNVAIYGLAFFIAATLLIPQKAISVPILPLVSRALKEKKMSEVKKLYRQSSINQMIIGGALFVLIWSSINSVYQLIPGEFYLGVWVVFYIGFSRLFILSTGISGPIIVYSKYYRVNLVFNLFLVGLTIFSNFILINKYGMAGAAMATAITFLIYNILKVVYIYYRFKMQPFTIETIKSIIILIITGLIGSYIEILPQNPIIDIILKSIIVAIVLIIGFYGFRVKAEILDVPRKMLKDFKR
jgi:O-antigen/teichoic acid export membrane protein